MVECMVDTASLLISYLSNRMYVPSKEADVVLVLCQVQSDGFQRYHHLECLGRAQVWLDRCPQAHDQFAVSGWGIMPAINPNFLLLVTPSLDSKAIIPRSKAIRLNNTSLE